MKLEGPIVLVRKEHVTLMKVGHEQEEFAYACGICHKLWKSKYHAVECCMLKKVKDETDNL